MPTSVTGMLFITSGVLFVMDTIKDWQKAGQKVGQKAEQKVEQKKNYLMLVVLRKTVYQLK